MNVLLLFCSESSFDQHCRNKHRKYKGDFSVETINVFWILTPIDNQNESSTSNTFDTIAARIYRQALHWEVHVRAYIAVYMFHYCGLVHWSEQITIWSIDCNLAMATVMIVIINRIVRFPIMLLTNSHSPGHIKNKKNHNYNLVSLVALFQFFLHSICPSATDDRRDGHSPQWFLMSIALNLSLFEFYPMGTLGENNTQVTSAAYIYSDDDLSKSSLDCWNEVKVEITTRIYLYEIRQISRKKRWTFKALLKQRLKKCIFYFYWEHFWRFILC